MPPSKMPSTMETAITTNVRLRVVSRSGQMTFLISDMASRMNLRMPSKRSGLTIRFHGEIAGGVSALWAVRDRVVAPAGPFLLVERATGFSATAAVAVVVAVASPSWTVAIGATGDVERRVRFPEERRL